MAESDLLQGTLDLLILKSLALQPMHGMGISRRISQITNGAFEVKAGSLFPALHLSLIHILHLVERQGFEDQEIEGALEEFGFGHRLIERL